MEGWRAMLGIIIEGAEASVVTFVFCPDCAEKEFGPPKRASAGWEP